MTFMRAFGLFWGAACLSLGAWASYMVYDNVPPYVWDGGPPPDGESYIDPDPAEQGSMITANWSIIKINRICPATLQRFFDRPDGTRITTLDTTEASRSIKIGDTVVPRSFQLPPNLPPQVDYSVLACFECNAYQSLIRPLCIQTPKIRFGVKQQTTQNYHKAVR